MDGLGSHYSQDISHAVSPRPGAVGCRPPTTNTQCRSRAGLRQSRGIPYGTRVNKCPCHPTATGHVAATPDRTAPLRITWKRLVRGSGGLPAPRRVRNEHWRATSETVLQPVHRVRKVCPQQTTPGLGCGLYVVGTAHCVAAPLHCRTQGGAPATGQAHGSQSTT